jgi:NDP-sugar pyrophosphorylase family protein
MEELYEYYVEGYIERTKKGKVQLINGKWEPLKPNLKGKYKLTDEFIIIGKETIYEKKLYRIKCINAFDNIKLGELGGFIESEKNLEHEGNAWVGGNAKVFDYAYVHDNAKVFDNAEVSCYAKIINNSQIFGNAKIMDNALIRNYAKIYDRALINGTAEIYDYAQIFGNVEIYGNARIFGNTKVFDDVKIEGNSIIHGDAKIYGRARIWQGAVIGKQTEICGKAYIFGNPTLYKGKYIGTKEYICIGPLGSGIHLTLEKELKIINGGDFNCVPIDKFMDFIKNDKYKKEYKQALDYFKIILNKYQR